MGEVVNIESKKEDKAEVIEVATKQLSLHSKQESLSPSMTAKQWKKFVSSIKNNGVLQPLTVTKGFRIIDGKHRLLAIKELGIEGVRVVIEDIPENEVASYIVENKLNRSELKNGQRAAMVVRYYYEELKEKGKNRMSEGGKEKVSPNGKTINTHKIIAIKAGVGQGSIGRLLPVYRNRPDLFERVFDGSYSI